MYLGRIFSKILSLIGRERPRINVVVFNLSLNKISLSDSNVFSSKNSK